MLEGLPSVDWEAVHHAYGPAVDVPDDLRALISTDAFVRRGAIHRLYGSIFHQGTRWRASRLAVPFLIELAVNPEVPERVAIIKLIGHLAVGYHEAFLWAGLDPSSLQSGEDAYARGENEFEIDELDVYRAVCSHADALLALCADDDPLVRHPAAYNLAFLPDIGERAVLALVGRAAAEDGTLRANALIAVALLCQSLGRSDPVGFDRYLDSPSPAVKFGAAVARARLEGPRADDAITVLIDALNSPPTDKLYWNAGDLVGFAATTLAVAQGRFGDDLTARLCSLLRNSHGPAAENLVVPILQSLFPRGPQDVPSSSSELTVAQRMVVETLAASPRSWTWDGVRFSNFSLTMVRWGLPRSAEDAARYLGGAPIEQLRPDHR
ncbi:MAG: HEAT repeat domain-containing protein [Acidimicrobiales bacterium]